MLINSKKLLPSSNKKKTPKLRAENFLVPIKNTQYKDTAPVSSPEKNKSNVRGSIKKDLIIIREKVISIEDILKKSVNIQNKNLINKSKDLENQRRRSKESKLEKKEKPDTNGMRLPSANFGGLSWIQNFIEYTVLGFVVHRLFKYLPQLIDLGKKLTPVITFVDSFIGGMANKLISFIEFGYNVHDSIRGLSKTIGGENGQKAFDDFSGKLNTFINLAIIAGMSTMGGTDFGSGKNGKGKTSKGSKPSGDVSLPQNEKLRKYLDRGKEAKTIERKFGNSAAQYYEELRNGGKNSVQAFKEVKRKFQPRGLFNKQTVSGLAGEGRTAGTVGRRGIGRSVDRLAIKTFGKGGAKIAGKIPIVGPLIDFGIRTLVFKEPLGKAAAGAVGAAAGQALGAWIGGSIGGIAGSVVPIIGNILAGTAGAAIGGLLGGLIGDQIGISLYETIVGSTAENVEGRAQGGQVSRGGKSFGGPIGRSTPVKRTKIKQQQIKVGPAKPGNDIGGESQITKIFNDENPNKKDQVSSLRSLKTTSNILKSGNNFLGQFMGVGVDLAMGQRPDKSLYSQFGNAFGAIVQQLIENNTQMTVNDVANSILGMANGGIVPPNSPTRGGDFGNKIGQAVASMFGTLIENQATLIINSLRIESLKKPLSGGDAGGNGQGDVEEGSPTLTGNTNAEKVFNYLVSDGFTEQAAAGVIGNLMRESGVNPDSNQLGGGKGRGIMQWSVDERWARLLAWAQASGKNPRSLDTQIAWMMKEMKEYGTYRRLKGISNVKAATDLFEKEMEGAGIKAMDERYRFAADALASFGSGGRGLAGGSLGAMDGNLSAAQQLASSMGLQMTSSVYYSDGTRRSGLHGAGRAMDFSNDGVGNGTPQQLSYANSMISKYGSNLKQLIYTPLGYGIANGKRVGLDYWGESTNKQHYNHVHVAFAKGGFISKPTRILAGERGREFMFDSNTTAAIEQTKPGLLQKLNFAKTKSQVSDILRSYADYEDGGNTVFILPIETEKSNAPTISGQHSRNVSIPSDSNIDNRIASALA
jgi:hypothetical protein